MILIMDASGSNLDPQFGNADYNFVMVFLSPYKQMPD
jgi:hypothetical protein